MRIRTVKPEFWDDDLVGTLSRDARLLFLATFNLADDEGLLRWTPPFIKSQVFMYDDDIDVTAAQKIMDELTEAGILFPYRGGKTSQRLAYVVNFRRHQRINRPQLSKLPPPSLASLAVREMYGRRDGYVCHLCNGPIAMEPTTDERLRHSVDHLETRFDGGSDHPSNIQSAHLTCNKSRGPKTVDEAKVNRSLNRSLTSAYECSAEFTPGRERKGREGKGREEEISSDPASAEPDPTRPDVEALCRALHERLRANGSKSTITKQWRDEARRMLDIDHRDVDKSLALIDWCQDSTFWRANIASIPKFRAKYDQLRLQALAEYEERAPRQPRSTTDDRMAAVQALRSTPRTTPFPQLRAIE